MTTDSERGAAARAAPDAIARSLEAARKHHDAGRLADAEALYRQVLAADADRPEALHRLGMIEYQAGRHAAALQLIDRALRTRPGDPEYHHDRGVVLQAQGRLDDALATYRQTIARAPAHADAYYNAGTVLHQQGNLDEAAACYRRALELAPDLAEAHNNLGTIWRARGRLDEAVERFRRASELQPRSGDMHFNVGSALQALGDVDGAIDAYRRAAALAHAGACNELGNALAAQGRLEDAARSYLAALERRPDFAEAHNNLGNVLLDIGAVDAAVAAYRRALELSDTLLIRANFARAMRHPHLRATDARLRGPMTRAVQEAWARPADLAPAAARLVAADARIGAMIECAARAWPARLGVDAGLGTEDLRALAGDALLRALLTNAPVRDLPLERLLAGVRAALLTRAESSPDDGDATLDLHAALARQCFVNEYVWAESEEEAQRVTGLGERLRAAMERGDAVPAAWLAAVASYRPLSTLAEARQVERAWPPAIAALIEQQIRAPGEEALLRASLARLTPIDDAISVRVQRQYEENPYPRWVALPPGLPDPLEARLRQRFPRAPLRPLSCAIDPEILIAGCGTGQEAIETAEQNPQSRILAIDLSAASLAYAQRMSAVRGVRNVDYAQADIQKLASLDRRFDAISSVGVLHHLDDPLAGWRILCGLLRPGGVMRIGLYSERARRGIAQARRYVARRGYPATAGGIRRARQNLAADATFEPITALRDFHATSECRDLLFHVQEREFTLTQIGEALRALDLTLLGFVLEPQVVRAYGQRFADDPAAVDLGNWARFEADHPETFLGMYVMWLQKA